MKKLLRLLFILVLLGLGFLYIVKNPEAWISQTILKAIGLERLTISDEPIAMGTGTFTLDEMGATFTLPQGRELQSAPTQENGEMKFVITTQEKDNASYPIYIRASYNISKDSLETIQELHKVQLTTPGQAFKVDCGGISPSACMGIYNSGIIYMLGFSSTSDQPMPTDQPSTFVVPRFAQVQQAIDDMLASVTVVAMSGNELTGTELTGSEDGTLNTQTTIGKYTIKTEQGKDIAGENIYLYDASGKKVFSLMAKDGDLQGVYDIVWDYLLVDVWSDLMREIRIYDIRSNEQIFTSSYATQPLFPDDQKWYELHIEGNKVFFSTLVYDKRQFNSKRQIATPKIIPTCPTKRIEDEIWYSELRSFDLDTKQVTKTGKIVCTFMQ